MSGSVGVLYIQACALEGFQQCKVLACALETTWNNAKYFYYGR